PPRTLLAFPTRRSSDLATFPVDSGTAVVGLLGNPNRKAEWLHDFELGYRSQISKQLSLDVAAFSSYYYGLQTQEPLQPFYELASDRKRTRLNSSHGSIS